MGGSSKVSFLWMHDGLQCVGRPPMFDFLLCNESLSVSIAHGGSDQLNSRDQTFSSLYQEVRNIWGSLYQDSTVYSSDHCVKI